MRKVTAEGVFDGHDGSDTQRIVRALHTRDDDPGTREPPFAGSLTPPFQPRPLAVRKLSLSSLGA